MTLLYFQTSADNAIAVPANQLKYIDVGATDVTLVFQNPTSSANGPTVSVVLTVAAGDEETVCKAVASAIAGGQGVVTIADDENSVYVTDKITSCGAITIDVDLGS